MPGDFSTRTLVWMVPSQLGLVRGVCARAGLSVSAVGMTERTRLHAGGAGLPSGTGAVGVSGAGGARELAEALAGGTGSASPPAALDDLRSALATTDAQLVLLAAPADFAAAPSSAEADAAVLAEAVKRGLKIVTLEPLPASVLQLGTAGVMSGGGWGGWGGVDAGVSGGLPGGGEWARFVPLMRDTRPMRDLADLAESFGPVQSVCLRMVGRPCHGSVGARLYDAAALLVSMLGIPDQAYAAYVGRLGWGGATGLGSVGASGVGTGGSGGLARGLRPLPGDSLRGLAGDISATLRYADGRAASVFVSDRAGEFSRVLTLVGERGTLAVSDAGLCWLDEDGREIDRSRTDEAVATEPAEELIAREVRRVIDPTGQNGEIGDGSGIVGPPVDAVRVLAVAGAVLLSARTGEVESPSTVLRMAGAG